MKKKTEILDMDGDLIPEDIYEKGLAESRTREGHFLCKEDGVVVAIKCPAKKAWCKGMGGAEGSIGLPFNCVGCDLYEVWQSMAIHKKMKSSNTQDKIKDVLDSMKDLLLYKNQKYGDSAINPKKIFYKGDSTNSILIRLDDKLGRVMANKEEKPRVNDVADIIGYCTLLLISMGVTSDDIAKFKD